MTEYFDREKANDLLDTSIVKAEEYVQNKDKLERLLQRLEKKLKTVPVAGGTLSYIPVMISMLRAYLKKEYHEFPAAMLVVVVAALIYWLSLADLMPDFLPGVGYLDDAAILAGAMSLIKTDLDDYINWRKAKGLAVEGLPDYTGTGKEFTGKLGKLRTFVEKKLRENSKRK